MARKIGVDMGGSWLRVGVLEPGPNGGTLPVDKHASPRGWGGNLVLGGRRVDGEPGHTNVRFESPHRCGCGNQGCNEALYSGSNMEQRIRANLPTLPPSASAWKAFDEAGKAGAAWAVALL